jgi:hypothetical protein
VEIFSLHNPEMRFKAASAGRDKKFTEGCLIGDTIRPLVGLTSGLGLASSGGVYFPLYSNGYMGRNRATTGIRLVKPHRLDAPAHSPSPRE